ncbi:MAG: hypothetical protein R3D30_00755 [Hyphomicrobiales bacterium]
MPLPLIGLGVVIASSGNPLAVEVELFLSGPGSDYQITRTADASGSPLPGVTAKLFTSGGKGPRADHYAAAQAVTDESKQLITASLTSAPSFTRAVAAVDRIGKGDRLKPTTSDVAMKRPSGRQLAIRSKLFIAFCGKLRCRVLQAVG